MIRLLRPRPLLIGWPEAVLAKADTPTDPLTEAARALSAKAHDTKAKCRATTDALRREIGA